MSYRIWGLGMGVIASGIVSFAAACECPKWPTPQQAIADASVVMEAYVLEKGAVEGEITSYKVSVDKIWKGERIGDAVVRVRAIDEECAGTLEVEKHYLLYLNGNDFELDACSRTFDPSTHKPRLSYQDDLVALKKGKK